MIDMKSGTMTVDTFKISQDRVCESVYTDGNF